MSLKAYTSYKSTETTWLGKLPDHWEVKRLGSTFFERREKVSDKDYAPLSVTKNGILPQLDSAAKSNDGDNRKKVCAGDFVINSRSDRKGSSGISTRDGSVSLINTVLNPHCIDSNYAHKLLKSYAFVEEFYRMGRGIVADLWSTKYSEMRAIMIPLPPLPEQTQIARFLDHKTAQINRFIKAKKRLIELLKEQKQAIINDAVTRGINQHAPVKSSKTAWFEHTPKHWESIRLGRVIKLTTGYPFPSPGFTQKDSATRLLRGINVTPFGIRWDSTVRWERVPGDGLDEFQLQVGDIVLGMDRPIVSTGIRAASIQPQDVPSLLLQRVARLRPKDRIVGKFLRFLLQGKLFAEYIAPIFTGISVPHLSPEQIKDFRVMLPPGDEQEKIIDHIERRTAVLNAAIARSEREINLMQEYRTRLIADAVTGKIDVRGIEVPNIAEEDLLEPIGEDTEEQVDEIEDTAEE